LKRGVGGEAGEKKALFPLLSFIKLCHEKIPFLREKGSKCLFEPKNNEKAIEKTPIASKNFIPILVRDRIS